MTRAGCTISAHCGANTLGVLFIRKSERQETNQLLLLLSETGERNLDYYFNSVQKSVGKVSTFVEEDILSSVLRITLPSFPRAYFHT